MRKESMAGEANARLFTHALHSAPEGNQEVLRSAKGEILKEFEKVCPTDMSFQRMKKSMHDIFDKLEKELKA